MQFCYVHDPKVSEQRLIGAFLRIYADAGVHTLAVSDGCAASQRCKEFLSVGADKLLPLPFVVEVTNERHALLGEKCTQWVMDLVRHAQTQMPADQLAAFCQECISATLMPTTTALLRCVQQQQPPTASTEGVVNVKPTRVTRNNDGSRISVTEAMQLGRDRETALGGPRQFVTTR